MNRRRFLGCVTVACVLSSHPSGQILTWRPVVMTDHGMIASGHPLASEAGLRILKVGGNAIDAAIATWAVQGLVEPDNTGLGADAFIMIYLAKTHEVKFINGTGPAAMAATIDFYKSKGGIPTEGPLTVVVPGAVSAAELAVQKYGSMPLSSVLAPAAEIAAEGFPVTETLANSLRDSKAKLAHYPTSTKIWFRNGEPLKTGERVVLTDLAATLKRIGRDGSADYYRGATAATTIDYLKANGGILAASDLAKYRAQEDSPISVSYRGVDVYECPPNSQGHVLLQALNILEGYDLKKMGHNTAPYLHVVTEALRLSFADRNRYVGDPKFVPPIPMQALLSKDYAVTRRALINPDKAMEGEPPAGDPGRRSSAAPQLAYAEPQEAPRVVGPSTERGHGLTTYLAVVDKDRNMVSITSSLLSSFGSGMVAGSNGFFLNDRMQYFYLDPNDVNALAPGKRTRHTINPALALKNGKPFLVFGTPGADTQPQTELQFFLNVVDFGMNVQLALEQDAVISTGFRDSYSPHAIEGKLLVPSSVAESVRQALASRGHRLDVQAIKGVGWVKAIMINPDNSVLMGGVSPKDDAYVMGW